ncbi:hypothetical protein [Methanobrevibacter sp.]|uniref:hypothetical protein n=1 Tax=Methanobrevibacter sp. TaxID=66852 RepID=UPI0026075F38|nr:hypothetical protein [uncultured Methanobrevibacter sp.]
MEELKDVKVVSGTDIFRIILLILIVSAVFVIATNYTDPKAVFGCILLIIFVLIDLYLLRNPSLLIWGIVFAKFLLFIFIAFMFL